MLFVGLVASKLPSIRGKMPKWMEELYTAGTYDPISAGTMLLIGFAALTAIISIVTGIMDANTVYKAAEVKYFNLYHQAHGDMEKIDALLIDAELNAPGDLFLRLLAKVQGYKK